MSNKQGSNIPWWAIVVGFMLSPPIGFIMLMLSLAGVRIGGGKTTAGGRGADLNAQMRQNAGTYRQTDAASARTGAGTAAKSATVGGNTYQKTANTSTSPKKSNGIAKLLQTVEKQIKQGRLMTAIGGGVGFVFLLGLVTEIDEAGIAAVGEWFPILGFLLAGLATAGFGLQKVRLGRRQRLYLTAIGNKSSIFLSDLAATAGVSEKRVLKDLQKMLTDGSLPLGAYIDRASGRLVLTDQGYQAAKEETRAKAGAGATAKVVQEATQEDKDRAILKQIRAINDAIPGEEMSHKIDRIEEITGKILAYARQNPSKSGELRQFLNYYLPTTLKILNAYARMDAQGVEGENISAAKARIEGMMDKVVDGFEKQLDQLFQSDAMDITTDVEVLERMLEKDGLGSAQGMTMTMGGSSASGAAAMGASGMTAMSK